VKGGHAKLVADLFSEQQGICYLCGGGMDLGYMPGSITWASLDHKVPLKRGGTWDRSNLAAAHRGCNTWKRDAFLEQLPDMRPGWPGTLMTANSFESLPDPTAPHTATTPTSGS
jgi:hypothetical protein